MKNCKKNRYLLFVLTLSLLLVSGCFSYNMELRSFSSIRFKNRFDNFTFHTKPVTPYELGMILPLSKPDNLPEVKTARLPPLSEKWLKDSLSGRERAEILEKIVDEITVNDTNDPLILTDNLDLEIVVPGLKELLTLFNADNFRTGTVVIVSADRLVKRKLVWSEVLKAVKNGQIKKDIADTIMDSEYVVAAEELTAYGYRVKIKVNRHTNPKLMFAMQDAFERHMKPENIFFSLSAVSPFVFTIEEPVAIAALWKKKPDKESMEKLHPPPLFEEISTWEPVPIPLEILYFMESKGPRKYDR